MDAKQDVAMMAVIRQVADAMQALAEARAGHRMLTTTDIASLVRWALLLEKAADAGERMGTALNEIRTIGGLLQGEAVASRVMEQAKRAIQAYPNLFAEYPLLTELRKLVNDKS